MWKCEEALQRRVVEEKKKEENEEMKYHEDLFNKVKRYLVCTSLCAGK